MVGRAEDKILEIIQSEIACITEDNKEETLTRIQQYFYRFENEIFRNNFIFVYGSLREGQYNYERVKSLFGDSSIQSICVMQLDYMRLHDLGAYPALLSSCVIYDYAIGEVVYVSDEAFQFIKEMEEGAGYIKDRAALWLRGLDKTVKMFIIPTYTAGKELQATIDSNRTKYPKIKCGDWIKYQDSTEEKVESDQADIDAYNARIQAMYQGDYGFCD